jgi:hypothetical protein
LRRQASLIKQAHDPINEDRAPNLSWTGFRAKVQIRFEVSRIVFQDG